MRLLRGKKEVQHKLAIVHLGAKRVQGLKIDRTNDSLGSSANGTNSGIT